MEATTGLKLNWSKSLLCPVGNVCEIKEMGLPLGAKSNSKEIWNPVIKRMGNKQAHWKGNYLSNGGKLVLLKSVLANVPIYFLSLYHAPISIINHMERLQQEFLWGASHDSRKIH